MRHVFSATLIAALMAAGIPHPAQASFASKKGMRVNPVNGAVFEVVTRGAAKGRDYWCGAGDYARRAVNAPWSASVYITRGLGQSETTGKRSAVQFTLDPAAAGMAAPAPAPGVTLSLNSLAVGESMTVQSALGYCSNLPASRN